jgi:hypothetical protein
MIDGMFWSNRMALLQGRFVPFISDRTSSVILIRWAAIGACASNGLPFDVTE